MRMIIDPSWKILWNNIPSHRKKQYSVLVVLIVFSSFAEVISLGAVVPFLLVLTDPIKLFSHNSFTFFKEFFSFKTEKDLLLPVTIFFMISSIVAGLIRIYLLKMTLNLSHRTGGDISKQIYTNVLYQDYLDHIEENSSKFISSIISKANQVVTYTIQPIINLFSSSFILLVIFTAMVTIDPFLILASFVTIVLLYLTFAVGAKRRLLANSKIMAAELSNLQKTLAEGFGGIRDVILDNTQEVYLNKYISSDTPYRNALAENAFKSSSPKYYVEAFGLVVFASFAYYLSIKHGSLVESLPLLGALALAAQRMLPVIQISYNSWANLKTGKAILEDVTKLLTLEKKIFNLNSTNDKLSFKDEYALKSVSFLYPNTNKKILDNIQLTIKKGDRIGIIGKTGSGKSTLLDLIMGLIYPSSGFIKVDGTILKKEYILSWQKNIAHVPQSIFLIDASISENVALGIKIQEINLKRVHDCLKQAELLEFVNSLERGIDTLVGERGVKLSGGQRQRIGIARALYKNAEVLIFDEATSALDEKTESSLMKSIYKLNKNLTLIIVAHRLTTISKCDYIFEMENGSIRKKDSMLSSNLRNRLGKLK